MSDTDEYNVNDLGFCLGHVTTRSSAYDGLTDDEAEELKAELLLREARRIPLGFRAPGTGAN